MFKIIAFNFGGFFINIRYIYPFKGNTVFFYVSYILIFVIFDTHDEMSARTDTLFLHYIYVVLIYYSA